MEAEISRMGSAQGSNKQCFMEPSMYKTYDKYKKVKDFYTGILSFSLSSFARIAFKSLLGVNVTWYLV